MMNPKRRRAPADPDESALRDIRRLRQRVERLKAQGPAGQRGTALALVDEVTTLRNLLAARARELRGQIDLARGSTAAVLAYRRIASLGPKRPGDRT